MELPFAFCFKWNELAFVLQVKKKCLEIYASGDFVSFLSTNFINLIHFVIFFSKRIRGVHNSETKFLWDTIYDQQEEWT